MEPQSLIKQTIRMSYASALEVAEKYYSLLLCLNNIHLPPRELQVLAYTAVRGSISSGGAKEGFIENYGSSKASIGNIVSSLTEQGLLVKEGKSTKVVKSLRLNFTRPIALNIVLKQQPHA
jgi:hypothetical protein